jgi:hypothetical protein
MPRKRSLVMLICWLVAIPNIWAANVAGHWSNGTKQDVDYFSTYNLSGDHLLLHCGNGGVSAYNAAAFIEIKSKLPPAKSTVDIVIDGGLKLWLYTDENGVASANSNVMRDLFSQFWTALRRGSKAFFKFSDGRTAEFSLKGTGRILSEKPCADAEERSVSTTPPALPAPSVADQIRSLCKSRWPDDFEMQLYCVNEQSKAAKALGY